MVRGDRWHPERIFFMVSAARHFASELRAAGFTVAYLQAPTTIDGLKAARAEFGELPIVCAEPSSFRQYAVLKKFGVEFVENDFFLTPRKLFMEWAGAQKTFLMENFYRKQRVRLGVLMEGDQPWVVRGISIKKIVCLPQRSMRVLPIWNMSAMRLIVRLRRSLGMSRVKRGRRRGRVLWRS
jgi:deoxyribodipyrimidine photolyase-like uncharacterized protein